MSVREINDESHFQAELTGALQKLVVVDFTATWYEKQQRKVNLTFLKKIYSNHSRCGPCQRIAPIFATLPSKFPNAVFLKVDGKNLRYLFNTCCYSIFSFC